MLLLLCYKDNYDYAYVTSIKKVIHTDYTINHQNICMHRHSGNSARRQLSLAVVRRVQAPEDVKIGRAGGVGLSFTTACHRRRR